jgi:hypothetical protein
MAAVFSTDGREQAKHLHMIHILASELGREEAEVGRVYEAEFERLNSRARVKDFLLVLVGRRVKENLGSQETPRRQT